MSAAVNSSLEGERTKFKALALHVGQTLGLAKVLDKKEAVEAPEAARLEMAAAILKDGRAKRTAASFPATTKPDVRFPNTNQAANCWCVGP